MRLLLLLSMATALKAQTVCSPGTYIGVAGICTFCMPGTYSYFTGSTACQTCPTGTISPLGASGCTPCNAGYYAISTASCAFCMPGTFSYYAGSTACQTCPAGTGSPIGASACVACAAPCPNCMYPCRYVNGSLCPTCGSACTSCLAGTYNDGSTKRCARCPAGTYSTLNQSVSAAACSACDPGKTTGPLDTGLTACVDCARVNQTLPLNAVYYQPDDPLVCSWACNVGYISVNASGAVLPRAPGYSPSQASAVAHVNADYCCSPTLATVGTYLSGCGRGSDGVTLPCAPVPNAHFFNSMTPKLNRCADWACNDDYYRNGTGGCVQQPRCPPGFTYLRDASGALVALPSGAYQCVPCSQCMDGAEAAGPCNRTADTACRLCSPTGFSRNGSACAPKAPPGFAPVIVRLTSVPPFQGRPAVWYDGTPIDWTQVPIKTGFFVNSFVQCLPVPYYAAYINDDAPCRRLDVDTTTCTQPLCRSQCRPWNGTAGWYLSRTGQCTACVYDPSCAADQYSDLSACGPTAAPVCRPCPGILPANAVRWLNPGRWTGPVCDFACRDGFVRSNASCIYCPNMPDNARPTVGCNWVCSLGFYQSGPNRCVPCAGVPTSCPVGAYLGYGPSDQCARCLPCANAVVNSVFFSAGIPNGPNTCGLKCVLGTFIDPAYGLDVYGNPVACRSCSRPVCVPGSTFFVSCASDADAWCAPCSSCPPGQKVSKQCTVGADIQCAPCDPPPANTSWSSGCDWSCNAGFYPLNGGCAPCLGPSACETSDSYAELVPGCGVCTPCNASLLLPGQCFNGDGQCGTTYRCGPTTTTMPQTTTVAQFTSSTTIAPTTPIPAEPVYYAALVVLSVNSAAPLSNLSNFVACANCTLRVLSIRRGNATVYCPACHRRLLVEDMVVEIAVITQTPVDPLVLVDAATTRSYPVPNATILNDAYQLSVYLRGFETPYRPPPLPWATIWGAFVIVAGVVAVICCTRPVDPPRRHVFHGVRVTRPR